MSSPADSDTALAELRTALLRSDLPRFKSLLANPELTPQVLSSHQSGWSLLHDALQQPLASQFALLLIQRNLDISVGDASGCSALLLAISTAQVSVISALVGAGANLKVRDQSARGILHHAVLACAARRQGERQRGEQVLRLLLEEDGVDVNCVDAGGWSALMLGAHSGVNPSAVQLLAAHGALIDLASAEQQTALMLAAMAGHVRVATQLLHLGASFARRCGRGLTAADWALEGGHVALHRVIVGFVWSIKFVPVLLVLHHDTTREQQETTTPLTRFAQHPLFDLNVMGIVFELVSGRTHQVDHTARAHRARLARHNSNSSSSSSSSDNGSSASSTSRKKSRLS